MTSPVPEPPAVPPNADPEADARFAAYLADLAAHVDHPVDGPENRAILDEDPQTQRALFDLAEAVAAGTASTPPLSMVATSVAALVLAALVATYIIKVLA